MYYQQKLDEARALVVQHNSQSAPGTSGYINADQFFKNLQNAGGTNEVTLSQCTWEDLQEFGLPKLLARQVANVFRAKEKEAPVLKRSRVEAMSVPELIALYDPRNKNLVFERLAEMFGEKRFIVFNAGNVDVGASAKLAGELLDDYPEREYYTLNDEPTKTYKVGERPDQSFDENPLYPGRILRPDGDCDQTNRSWSGVPLEVRQILHLAVKSGEIKINSVTDAHNAIDLAVREDSLKVLRQRYSKSAASLKEMQQQGRAPTLKVFKKVASEKQHNPFGPHRNY